MFSLRAIARAAPKSSFRSLSTSRALSSVQRPNVLRASWTTIASKPVCRSFATSPLRFEPAGQVDVELSAKIEQEIGLEKESKDSQDLPPALQDFVENGGFEVKDTPGSEEIILTKKFGDENIKVTFSIADLNALDEDPDQFNEDNALADEDYDDDLTPQSAGSRSKGAINSGRTQDGNFNVAPEDSVAPADRPELADNEDGASDDDLPPGFPVRVNVTVTKPNGRALQLECIASDGMIDIENVYHFPTADLADAQTAEKDFKRQEIYAGPPFSNLDEELQILFERYLDERGINSALAQFAPDYIDYKEQREYVKWLGDVKNFVDA